MSALIPGATRTPAEPASMIHSVVHVAPGQQPAVEIHQELVNNLRVAYPKLTGEDADQIARFTLDYARISVFNVLSEAAEAVTHLTHADPVTNAIGEDVRHAAHRTICTHRDRFDQLNRIPAA